MINTKEMKDKIKVTRELTTNQKQKLFIDEYIKNKANVGKTCEAIGISRECYYKWLKKANFKHMIDEAFEELNDVIQTKIYTMAEDGHPKLLEFWAKTIMKHRGFVERTEIVNSGRIEISTEELQKAKEHIKKMVEDADNL
jgi:predicted DNA-binding protein YlxM (UPF0122 family)